MRDHPAFGPQHDAGRLLSALPDLVFVLDSEGRLQWANAACERVLGWDLEEWLGRTALELVHPDDLQLALLSLESVQGKEIGSPIDVRVATAVGGWCYLEIVGTSLGDRGEHEAIVIVARDVTQRRRFEVAHDDLQRFRALVQNSAAITMLLRADGSVVSVSGAFTRVLGHDPELAEGVPLTEWVVAEQRTRVEAALADAASTRGTTNFDATLLHHDPGRAVPLELNVVNLLDDPVVEGLVLSAYDVTPLREAQATLQHMATHDALTNLPNRTMLFERLGRALRRAEPAMPVTVFFIDLDRFKPINDLLGHEAGDQLLVEVGRRLQHTARDADLVSRLGGDEFVVVAEGIPDRVVAQRVAQRLEATLAQPVVLDAGPTQVFGSVGLARAEPRLDRRVARGRRRCRDVPREGGPSGRGPGPGGARDGATLAG